MGTTSKISRLLEITKTKWVLVVAACITGAIASLLHFAPALFAYFAIMELITSVMTQITIDYLKIGEYAVWAMACYSGYGVLTYIGNMMSHVAAYQILYELRIQLTKKLSRLGLGYFSRKSSGSIKRIMSEDVENIELFVAHHTVDITSAFVVLIVTIITMLFIDWRLSIATIIPIISGVYIYARKVSQESQQELMRKYYEEIAEMNATAVEFVNGMQVLKVFNQTTVAFKKLAHDIKVYAQAMKIWNLDYKFDYSAFLTLTASALSFVIPVGVLVAISSSNLVAFVPKFFFFLLIAPSLNSPMTKLMYLASLLTQTMESVYRIDTLLKTSDISDPIESKTIVGNSIRFERVSFSYEEEEVLHDVSFSIEEGEVIGLVGPSGSGKSTIAQLLARFWDVNQGKILVGGCDIREVSLETLMTNVSFVFQDVYMFRDTIENNIRMGNMIATLDDVIAAAQAAQAHEFIMNLPAGYQTILGDSIHLSGGEQQRVSIARTILKNAPIIILDEATAYADAENEGKIQQAFAALMKNKTVIVIAHRLSTITKADRILVVDQGALVEQGDHEKLMRQKGLYHDMYVAYMQAQEWTLGVTKKTKTAYKKGELV